MGVNAFRGWLDVVRLGPVDGPNIHMHTILAVWNVVDKSVHKRLITGLRDMYVVSPSQ